LNGVRRDRAYQSLSNTSGLQLPQRQPVPALDLLATAAINAQLVWNWVLSISKFSLQQAQAVAGTWEV